MYSPTIFTAKMAELIKINFKHLNCMFIRFISRHGKRETIKKYCLYQTCSYMKISQQVQSDKLPFVLTCTCTCITTDNKNTSISAHICTHAYDSYFGHIWPNIYWYHFGLVSFSKYEYHTGFPINGIQIYKVEHIRHRLITQLLFIYLIH